MPEHVGESTPGLETTPDRATATRGTSAGIGSGILLIDKAQDVTSHDVVAAIRSRLHVRRVGHAGTLDPMATGLLVVGFGHATRLLNFIVEHEKTYEATIRLGQSTTTDDAEGDVVHTVPLTASISRPIVERTIADRFFGGIEQVPSTYSAIKVGGQRAYDLARRGEHVELTARTVTISEFSVRGVKQASAAGHPVLDVDVRVRCSAGTYIRALARDLGSILGVGGHLTSLRRTAVGSFSIDDPHVIGSRAERHTVVDCLGQTTQRMRARVPDADTLRGSALTLLDAVRSTLPTLALTPQEAADIRFGRRIDRHIDSMVGAFEAETRAVVAILKPDGEGRARSVVVFPTEMSN